MSDQMGEEFKRAIAGPMIDKQPSTEFTENEINWLQENSEALRIVADYHDFNESMSDAMGANCTLHRKRRILLNAEADRIEKANE